MTAVIEEQQFSAQLLGIEELGNDDVEVRHGLEDSLMFEMLDRHAEWERWYA